MTTAFANSSCFPGFGQKLPSELLFRIDEGIYANTDAETSKCVSICDLATVIATTFLLTLKGPAVLESLAKFTGFADDLSKAMEVFHDLRYAIVVSSRLESIERTVGKVQSDVDVLQEGFSAVSATASGASSTANEAIAAAKTLRRQFDARAAEENEAAADREKTSMNEKRDAKKKIISDLKFKAMMMKNELKILECVIKVEDLELDLLDDEDNAALKQKLDIAKEKLAHIKSSVVPFSP